MPLYEYVCSSCRQSFEKYVKGWGESVACPACASPTVEKQVSTFGFAFAGATPSAAGGGCGCGRGGCGCGH